MAKRKKYYKVVQPFTLKGKLHDKDSRVYLNQREKEILMNKNLIK